MPPITVTVVVEGVTDEPVARRLLRMVGYNAGPVYVQRGKDRLDARLPSYNQAARHSHWLVIRDMDMDADCPSELVKKKLPAPSSLMSLRIAVRAVEAWLLADGEMICSFLGVSRNCIPLEPEKLQDPKSTMVQIATRSRRREIREDMITYIFNDKSWAWVYISH